MLVLAEGTHRRILACEIMFAHVTVVHVVSRSFRTGARCLDRLGLVPYATSLFTITTYLRLPSCVNSFNRLVSRQQSVDGAEASLASCRCLHQVRKLHPNDSDIAGPGTKLCMSVVDLRILFRKRAVRGFGSISRNGLREGS